MWLAPSVAVLAPVTLTMLLLVLAWVALLNPKVKGAGVLRWPLLKGGLIMSTGETVGGAGRHWVV